MSDQEPGTVELLLAFINEHREAHGVPRASRCVDLDHFETTMGLGAITLPHIRRRLIRKLNAAGATPPAQPQETPHAP